MIAYGFNYSYFLDEIEQGRGIRARNLVPPGFPGRNSSVYGYDLNIEEARKLPPAVIDRIEYDLKQQWQTEHINDLEEKVDEILFWCREVDQELHKKKDK